jgi:hypothetical protein
MFLGKVLVITDDASFRRFSPSYATEFGFETSEFIVTPLVSEEVIDAAKRKESVYDFVVYITTNELVSGMDKVLYCHGVGQNMATEDVMTQLEKEEYTDVYVTLSKVGDSKAMKIEPSKGVMEYIFSCEENQEFIGTKDVAYSSMLYKFFEKEMGIPKNSIKGLLQRKG